MHRHGAAVMGNAFRVRKQRLAGGVRRMARRARPWPRPGRARLLLLGPRHEARRYPRARQHGLCGAVAVDPAAARLRPGPGELRSEEHTSELQSLMRISYAVFCLK